MPIDPGKYHNRQKKYIMASNKFRELGFICGIICLLAGIFLIIIDMFLIKDSSLFLYNGIIFSALGAVFMGINLPEKKS